MIKLALGMLFILVNFSIDIGKMSFNILPEFAGWLFILSSLNKLKVKSPYFNKISGFVFAMSMYKVAEYIVSMLNINAGIIATVFFYTGIAATVAGLILQYRIFCGTDEIVYNDDVRAPRMSWIFVLFKIGAVLTALAYINNITGIYYSYANWGNVVPGLTRPIVHAFSGVAPEIISALNTIGLVLILAGVVIKIFIILFMFEVCTDYDKIMAERSGRKSE